MNVNLFPKEAQKEAQKEAECRRGGTREAEFRRIGSGRTR
jgi:hypothetical protein